MYYFKFMPEESIVLEQCEIISPLGNLSETVADLIDDPFRSLAGALRRAGGCAKETTPFSEFLWADFLRRRMKRKDIERDFEAAVDQALSLARREEADYLPGWCGPSAP